MESIRQQLILTLKKCFSFAGIIFVLDYVPVYGVSYLRSYDGGGGCGGCNCNNA